MFKNIQTHKPGKSGLCVYSLIVFLFFIVNAFALTSCDNNAIEDDPNPENNDSIPKEEDVIVLSPEDIIDYDKFYKPNEFSRMDMLRDDSRWSFVRSRQSEHFIVFWEPGFGLDPNASSVPADLRVDIDDLLNKAESFFRVNIDVLKFADLEKSNLSKYKMQIYLLFQREWAAYGGGIDDVIGGLWINPSTCKPVGSTIAHEIGHSFQYQVYADLIASKEAPHDFTRGFRYGFGGNGGNGFWEQTAQWQAYESYPMEAFVSHNFNVYMDNHNRHICHEWQRYASYFIHYYWVHKHGKDIIAKIWREAVSPEDPIEAYQRINQLSMDELNAEFYEAATRFVTWDLDDIRDIGKNFIGRHAYKFYANEDGKYQVSYKKCPGTGGYNVIPLNVPAAGTTVTTRFEALQPGSALAADDPGNYDDNGRVKTTRTYNKGDLTRAGWRYGYVALLNNGERIYSDMNRLTAANVEFTIPENCFRLWFVVTGAPTTYTSHPWDENESNDDQWPYTVQFTNTDILGNITIDPGADPESRTITFDVSFPADAANYSGTLVDLNVTGDIEQVAQAFVLQPSAISGLLLSPKATPQEGKIAFAAVEPSGEFNYNTTANGHGFWFSSTGAVIGWGASNDSKVFVEFDVNRMEFSVGQYPGKCASGDKFTVKEALIYKKNGQEYVVTFIFNITIR